MAGINIYGILADYTGKNVEELKQMTLTYDDISSALQTASQEGGKYYKGQEQGASTLNGQINRLKKSFQELLGELSKSLMPTIKNMTKRIQKLADWFSGLSDSQKQVITKVGLLVTALGPALIIIGKLITAGGTIFKLMSTITGAIANLSVGTGALSQVFTVLTGPIGLIIAGVTALIAVFAHLYKSNEDFRNKVNETFNGIVTLFQEHIMPLLQAFGELVKSVLDTIVGIIQNVWSTIEPFIQTIFETIMNLWNGFGKDIVALLSAKYTFLVNLVSQIWNNVISPIINFVSNVLLAQISVAIGLIVNHVSGVVDIITTAWDSIKGIFTGIIDFIEGTFTGDWETAWNGVVEIFTSIWDGLTGVAKGVINLIIGALNTFIEGINKISFDVPDWVPGIGGKKWGFDIPTIPELAKGGIVDKATLAMIGEGKSAEAVIPLDRTLTKYMAEALKQAGAGNMTVNFYPQQMTEAELERAFNYVDRRYGMAY